MNMISYRTVILEIDALLAGCSAGRAVAWTAALRNEGFDVAFSDVRERAGRAFEDVFAELTGRTPEAGVARRVDAERRNRFQALVLPGVSVLPGVRDLLARIRHEGYRVVVTSSSDSDSLCARELVEQSELSVAFDELVVLPRGSRGKPAPDVIRRALEQTRTGAGDAIVLGDTPYDLKAARSAGAACIGFLSGGWPSAALTGAVAVYREPMDLLANFDMSPLSRSSVYDQTPLPDSSVTFPT